MHTYGKIDGRGREEFITSPGRRIYKPICCGMTIKAVKIITLHNLSPLSLETMVDILAHGNP